MNRNIPIQIYERLKPLEALSAAAKSPVASEPPDINTQVGFFTDLNSFITNNTKQKHNNQWLHHTCSCSITPKRKHKLQVCARPKRSWWQLFDLNLDSLAFFNLT